MFFKRKRKEYLADQSGQYAIMMAILGLPLVMAASAAMDFSSAQSEYSNVKNALDNAVLAAATNNKASLSEKEKIALLHFKQNYSGRANVTAVANAEGDVVEMTAEGLVPFSVSEALGVEGVEIGAKSAAKRSEENVICVLALSPSKSEAIKFSGGVEFFAPNCSVHANSSASNALSSIGQKAPVAGSFCATGGVRGSYSPFAKGECLNVADPYANISNPAIGNCVPVAIDRRSDRPTLPVARVAGAASDVLADVQESINRLGDNAVVRPGTYCGGLTVDGRNVKFLPGEYVMLDGPLTIKNSAEALGDRVTIGFKGDDAVLRVELNANADFSAPSTGARKGIVFMQMDNSASEHDQKSHVITSGGSLNINGTVYLPSQTLVVSGVGTQMGAQAPATSFIADSLVFEGEAGSRVQVNVDHRKAGLPPLLPRAEEGAILIE